MVVRHLVCRIVHQGVKEFKWLFEHVLVTQCRERSSDLLRAPRVQPCTAQRPAGRKPRVGCRLSVWGQDAFVIAEGFYMKSG